MLAAETGSGKTLAYLAPLTELALQKHRQAAAAAVAREEGAEAQDGEDAWHHQRHRRRQHSTAALVLCPNVALCEQVLAAAQALRDPASGAPLAAAAFVSAQSPPPLSLPDVVITTPGALVSLLDNAGTAYGYEWTRAGRLLLVLSMHASARLRDRILSRDASPPAHASLLAMPPRLATSRICSPSCGGVVGMQRRGGSPTVCSCTTRPPPAGLPHWARTVVFDEADLLLSGGYGAQMRIIWDALRAGDRLHAARRICLQARQPRPATPPAPALPRPLRGRSACCRHAWAVISMFVACCSSTCLLLRAVPKACPPRLAPASSTFSSSAPCPAVHRWASQKTSLPSCRAT